MIGPAVQLFSNWGVFEGMKTFLKISLLVVLALVALKCLPFLLAVACIGLLVAAVLGACGLTLAVVLLAVGLLLAVALSPIWLTVLLVLGVVSLGRRIFAPPAAPPAGA